MPFGTEVGLDPGLPVFDGGSASDPAPPYKVAQPSSLLFVPCLLWPNDRPSQLLMSTCYASYTVAASSNVCLFYLIFCV